MKLPISLMTPSTLLFNHVITKYPAFFFYLAQLPKSRKAKRLAILCLKNLRVFLSNMLIVKTAQYRLAKQLIFMLQQSLN